MVLHDFSSVHFGVRVVLFDYLLMGKLPRLLVTSGLYSYVIFVYVHSMHYLYLL